MPTSSLMESTAGQKAAGLSAVIRGVLLSLLSLLPLVAHAEEQDLGEVVHAIFIVGIFAMIFFVGLSMGIWLLVIRLRDRIPSEAEKSGQNRPNLESIWFPTATAVPALSDEPAAPRSDDR